MEVVAITYRRGDVVWARDPFRLGTDPRPWLVLSSDSHPFHGEEYLCAAMSTTRRQRAITVREVHWVEGSSPQPSMVNPWSGMTIEDWLVNERQGRLHNSFVDRVAGELARYAGVEN